jgi:iron complex outermembrane recepter protein
MGELMNARNGGRDFRWRLLTTVSALALLASAYAVSEADAADNDADRPTLWIELGGQLEHTTGQGEPFAPAFLAANPHSSVLQSATPLQAQNPPAFAFAEEGKLTFQPDDSNWVFSVAVNYGRSSNSKLVDHQTNRVFSEQYPYTPSQYLRTDLENFANTHVQRRESHAILDFSVGKDVGLGMFGRESSSVLSLGVRFAQFASKETFDIKARPDLVVTYQYFGPFKFPNKYFHNYHATGQATRNFHGIGPSLSWNGSAPVAGNPQNGEISFDWGANAALLFGKQKAVAQHQETAHTGRGENDSDYSTRYEHPVAGHSIARTVTVPNVGGFAGASYRIEDFKVSFGYRADFFFGAIDGGIDTRKSQTLGFYGPFASVSVGLGG